MFTSLFSLASGGGLECDPCSIMQGKMGKIDGIKHSEYKRRTGSGSRIVIIHRNLPLLLLLLLISQK